MTTTTGPTRPRRRRSGLDPHSPTFALFSDVLYAGVAIVLLSLPVVTWFAAFSAGVQALREAREADGHVTIAAVWRAFAQRIRRTWVVHLVLPTVVTMLLLVDVVFLPYTGLDPFAVLVLPIVLAAALGAIALRIAGAWRTDVPARQSLALAWSRMSQDAAGSLLLALAVAAAGAIVFVLPLLAVVMPGPLALAAVAMDRSGGASEEDGS